MAVELKAVHTKGSDNPAFQMSKEDLAITNPDDVKVDMMKSYGVESLDATAVDELYGNTCSRAVYDIQQTVYRSYKNTKEYIWTCIYIMLTVLYFIYFTLAVRYEFGGEPSWRLLICTAIGVFLIMFNILQAVLHKQCKSIYKRSIKPCVSSKSCGTSLTVIGWCLKLGVAIFLIVYIIVDVAIYYPQNLIAVAGQAIYILLFYIFSTNPARVNWHPVFWGFALQYIFALIILRWYYGYLAFKWLGDRVTEFLKYADTGAIFLFGEGFEEHFFAFKVLSIIVFFYAVISVLYYLGVMQAIIRVLGRFLAFCMGTTSAESLNAAGNIFVGMTEAPLLIRPFLKDMTLSELHAVMTGGFATIAGSVLGAYISFGVPANHLMSASVMSAPAALAISKLACPETEVSKASSKDFYKMEKGHERNVIEAASTGATASVKLVAAVAVNVLAFLSILKFVNETLIWFGDRVGWEGFTFEFICSYVFFPISFFMGTDLADCRKVAELIGLKSFTNEFVAYLSLSGLITNKATLANYTTFFNQSSDWFWDKGNIFLPQSNQTLVGGILSDKSEVIATYALCGFSNFGSIGIILGGLGALAPTRKRDLAKIVIRAVVSGTVACFLTACIAGLLYTDY